MALGKQARQFSTYINYVASLAVDGNNSTAFKDGSCSHTGDGDSTWWQVNLGEEAIVSKVGI